MLNKIKSAAKAVADLAGDACILRQLLDGVPDRPERTVVDVDAHSDDREHDVREHHGRVDVVSPHRLERYLGA